MKPKPKETEVCIFINMRTHSRYCDYATDWKPRNRGSITGAVADLLILQNAHTDPEARHDPYSVII
jgi:hypothetical protein